MPDRKFTLSKDASEWDKDIGPVLTEQEAAALLAQQLHMYYAPTHEESGSYSVPPSGTAQKQSDLVHELIKLIPEEMRTTAVLTQMDMRSILREVMANPDVAAKQGDVTVNGVTFTPGMRGMAASAFVEYRDRITDKLKQDLTLTGMSTDQAQDFVEHEMSQYRNSPGQIIRIASPVGQVMTDPNTNQIVTQNANKDLTSWEQMVADLNKGDTAEERPAFLTPQDVQRLFRDLSADTAINQYMNDLSARSAYGQGILGDFGKGVAPADQTRVDLGELSGLQTPIPSQANTGTMAGVEAASSNYGRSYTLTEALSLPTKMGRAEVQRLSDKMEKAGLYAQVGGDPFVKGDPQDPQFREAYRLMLSKSIQRGEPVTTVLQTDMLAYEEELDKNVRAKLTDPARIRASADSLGKQILGRKLSTQDQAALVKFINDLEHTQAKQEGDEDGGDVTQVDYEARMAEYIRNANQGEAGAHDTALEYDMFRKMIMGGGG